MPAEHVDVQWQRPRGFRRVHLVALVVALLAGACLLMIFSGLGHALAPRKPQQQLVADIDLRIGNTILAAQRGEAQARIDVEAGALQLQTFGLTAPPTAAEKARAARLKRLYGITWFNNGDAAPPMALAYADGYNRVVEAEITRKYGAEFLARLKRGEDPGRPKPEKDSAS